ncbi:unnamed protein product, partial [marine sediment metagenome]
LVGDLRDRHVLIIDDMVDTAGTIISAAETARDNGALSITAVATHALFSGSACERLQQAPVDHIIVTDTVDFQSRNLENKLEVISVVKIFAASIQRITEGQSLSSLFELEG